MLRALKKFRNRVIECFDIIAQDIWLPGMNTGDTGDSKSSESGNSTQFGEKRKHSDSPQKGEKPSKKRETSLDRQICRNLSDLEMPRQGSDSTSNQGIPMEEETPAVAGPSAGVGEINFTNDEINNLLHDQQRDIEAVVENTGAGASNQTTYANVAKKRKQEFPFILCISKRPSAKITSQCMNAFEEYIFKKMCELEKEEADKINIEWQLYRPEGFGLIAPSDHHSAAWVKKLAAEFRFGETELYAWARWERAQAYTCRGFLHGGFWKTQRANFVINKILGLNGLSGEFTNVIYNKNTPNGVFVSFEPDQNLAKALLRKPKLKAGGCCLNLQIQLRKPWTEAEYLKFVKEREEKAAQKAAKRSSENDEKS